MVKKHNGATCSRKKIFYCNLVKGNDEVGRGNIKRMFENKDGVFTPEKKKLEKYSSPQKCQICHNSKNHIVKKRIKKER